jgi:hypothetical protein
MISGAPKANTFDLWRKALNAAGQEFALNWRPGRPRALTGGALKSIIQSGI